MNEQLPPASKLLQKLYLTLFLRGRSSRGLKKDEAPKSVASKLKGTLAIYLLSGLLALTFIGQPPFLLSLYLHGMTLLFLGMFVATTAGEILFNKDESEILLHRPVDPKTLLWAKVAVLLKISLWMACAFNLVGLFVGTMGDGGTWVFIPAHLLSTGISAIFCAGGVVLLYQICLRWFGQERLDSLMTMTQVVLMIVLVAGSQMVPHIMRGMKDSASGFVGEWWIFLLPPAWFASIDQVLSGTAGRPIWGMALLGVGVTITVVLLAFGRMARFYHEGLQSMNESRPSKPRKIAKRRLIERLADLPPFSWMLRDPITRATFGLTVAYMLRDRDTKLRLYPGMAPIIMMPAVFLFQGGSDSISDFGVAIAGGYLGLVPLLALNLLQYSQSWQAADIYRVAPVTGPAPFIHGAIQAVGLILVVPGAVILTTAVLLLPGGVENIELLLPGLIAMPVYALIPGAIEKAVPLSKPTEEAKSGARGGLMFLFMMSALIVPSIAIAAQKFGYLVPFLAIEALAAGGVGWFLNRTISRKKWDALE